MLSKLEISSHHRTILFTSTLVPGIATGAAALLLSVPECKRESFSESIRYLSSLLEDASTGSILIASVFLLIVAFAIGLAVRGLTFETIRAISPGHNESLAQLRDALARIHGPRVDVALEQHTAVAHLLNRSRALERGDGHASGDADQPTQRELAKEAFDYAKAG